MYETLKKQNETRCSGQFKSKTKTRKLLILWISHAFEKLFKLSSNSNKTEMM